MLEIADDLGGEAIRHAFHFVDDDKTVYPLVMDIAGGHGTTEAVAKYTQDLKTKYNIKIIHQVPRSPETNVLDLGIWCSLQWAIDREMERLRNDASCLAKAIERVWENKDLQIPFEKVWNRLARVLGLIKKGNGGNELVETERGKLYEGLDQAMAEEFDESLEGDDSMGTIVDPDIALED